MRRRERRNRSFLFIFFVLPEFRKRRRRRRLFPLKFISAIIPEWTVSNKDGKSINEATVSESVIELTV